MKQVRLSALGTLNTCCWRKSNLSTIFTSHCSTLKLRSTVCFLPVRRRTTLIIIIIITKTIIYKASYTQLVVVFCWYITHIQLLQALKQCKMIDGRQEGVKIVKRITRLEYEENNKIPSASATLGFQLCK